MNQPDIAIKEAGKGGAVAVLSKNHYRAMLYEHLSNLNSLVEIQQRLTEPCFLDSIDFFIYFSSKFNAESESD